MADNATMLPDRGRTWFLGTTPPTSYEETVDLEGQVRSFDDIDSTTGVALPETRRSGKQVVCKLVRNTSGVTLLPKMAVKYQGGHEGRRVNGYCNVDSERCAGIVDEFYSSSAFVNNDLGWIVVSGPCLAITAMASGADTNFSAGDLLVAATAAASTFSTTAGRAHQFVATSNATYIGSSALNYLGVVISARTTNQTNTDTLIDVQILKST